MVSTPLLCYSKMLSSSITLEGVKDVETFVHAAEPSLHLISYSSLAVERSREDDIGDANYAATMR